MIGDDTAGGIAAIDGGAKHEESMGFSGTAAILDNIGVSRTIISTIRYPIPISVIIRDSGAINPIKINKNNAYLLPFI